jgi:Asp-tRNA(Asn)/Glu-tRNA(Gln) amidotransferase A subunit family amidase
MSAAAEHPQDLTLREQARAVAAGELDATELLDATLSRIDERDGPVNSIADTFASESARMLTEAPEGPLHGVPVAVKDMFTLPWRAPRDGATRNLQGFGPGESAVYRRLRDAGAVIVAVTNMHEFGAGSTGHVSAYGSCATPWDTSRCAGGSSGGSGAAVAARLVAGAVGTDGGGSIRYPAAYCGITGLKFTWGVVPPDGYTHGHASLGAPGPMCRDAADARLLGEALAGRPLPERRATDLRLGIVRTFWDDIDPEVLEHCDAAVERLREAGISLTEVELDGTEFVRIATVLRLGLEGDPFIKPEIWEAIQDDVSPVGRALAKYLSLAPATAVVRTDLVRAQLRRSLVRAFEHVDVLAWPMVPAPPPLISDPRVQLPSGEVPADYANVRQGGIGNLTGVPAASVPCGFTRTGLPIALHVLTHWGEDERLLDVAELLEQATERRYVDAIPPLAHPITTEISG